MRGEKPSRSRNSLEHADDTDAEESADEGEKSTQMKLKIRVEIENQPKAAAEDSEKKENSSATQKISHFVVKKT